MPQYRIKRIVAYRIRRYISSDLTYKKNIFSVTSSKVDDLNSTVYAEFKYVLSFSLSRKVFN
jgi:hypothetical protein